jgi:hypothetical protein
MRDNWAQLEKAEDVVVTVPNPTDAKARCFNEKQDRKEFTREVTLAPQPAGKTIFSIASQPS